ALGLIILGVVLFINNFTAIEIADLYKYWPILIISVGLEMFVYIVIYRHDENVKLRLDALCIIFIIIAGIAASYPSFKLNQVSFDIFDINSTVNGVKYRSQLQETITKDGVSKDFTINKLEVRNDFGDIKVLPHDENYIKVEALVKIKHNDEKAAREYLERVLNITEGEKTQISAAEYNQTNKNDYSRAEIDFVIYIPQGVEADLDCSFGDIQAQGVTKDLVVNDKHGNITVKDIGGSAVIKNSFGDIELKNIGGKVEADNQHGDIEADTVNGAARLETSFGAIEALNIRSSLNVKNSYGKITVSNVTGDAEIKSSFGDIDASNIDGDTVISNNNGSIDVNELMGDVQITNSFGRIQYSSPNAQNADIYAKTKFGDIETDLPLNKTKSVNDNTIEGKTGKGKYRIELTTNNGEIEIK
ncbi:MAG: hypothetical protein K0R84_2335, partial [Clostridia bacterium]|nr:hypothetical protein [Clostridia bacterium]